jgi:hypothetical protein
MKRNADKIRASSSSQNAQPPISTIHIFHRPTIFDFRLKLFIAAEMFGLFASGLLQHPLMSVARNLLSLVDLIGFD